MMVNRNERLGSGSAQTWSAALRFAPTQRPRKKPSTTPTAASLSALRSVMGSHEELPTSSGPRIVGPAKASAFSAAPTISAQPTLYHQQPAPAPSGSSSAAAIPAASSSTSGFGPVGRTIAPPSMTLDDADVNGFKGTSAGKKANRNNKKRGNTTKTVKREDPSLSYHPSVVYEVGKPCDYVSNLRLLQRHRVGLALAVLRPTASQPVS